MSNESIFSSNLENATNESPFVKTADLPGKKWKIKKIEIVKSKNVAFGVSPTDALYQRDVLKEGETLRYNLINEKGEDKIHENKSITLYFAFRGANLTPNDYFTIDRTGAGKTTRYVITKVI